MAVPAMCSTGVSPVPFWVGKMEYARITIDAGQMGGVPCIRGLRIPIAAIIDMLSQGMSETDIFQSYPDLELDDIHEALAFAAEAVRELYLPLKKAEK